MVRPFLEYDGVVWDPYFECQIQKLEAVQKRAARFVPGNYRRMQSVTDMIKELEWDSLEDRRRVKRVMGAYKAYIGDEVWKDIGVRIESNAWKGKDDHDHKLALDFRHKGVGRFSLLGKGVRDWNKLPREMMNNLPKTLKEF